MRAWLVRAGRDGEFWPVDRDHGVVVIGWPEIADLAGIGTRQEIAEVVRQVHPIRAPALSRYARLGR